MNQVIVNWDSFQVEVYLHGKLVAEYKFDLSPTGPSSATWAERWGWAFLFGGAKAATQTKPR